MAEQKGTKYKRVTGSNAFLLKSLSLGNTQHGEVGCGEGSGVREV